MWKAKLLVAVSPNTDSRFTCNTSTGIKKYLNAQVYLGGNYLIRIVSNISVKQTKVVLILFACSSWKLRT